MPAETTSTYSTRPLGVRALKRELFWHELKRRRFRTPAEVRDYQLDRLRNLIAYAGTHVPFYRDRFRSIGLEPGDIRTVEDYARIPILTRQQVIEHLPELWSRAYRREDLLFLGTGGSTGVPMNYYKDVEDLDCCQVVLARSQQWAGKQRWDLLAFFGSKREPAGLRGDVKRVARAMTERRLFFDSFGASADDFAQWVATLRRYRPPFVYGYPSALEQFAAWARESGASMPPFRGVIVSAETLYAHQRALLEEVFRAPIFNFYGSREVPNIAATCAAQRMHQVADWVFLEFVPDRELPAPQLIVTPLECRSMPLIRYANGDLGSPVEGQCACGLPYPLMAIDVARVVDVFLTPEGKHVYGQFFTHLLYGIGGVKQFQFHQVSPGLIRLLIVKSDAFDTDTEHKLRSVVEDIHGRVSAGIAVRIEYLDEIPRTAVGKHLFTRSDVWAARNAAAAPPTAERDA